MTDSSDRFKLRHCYVSELFDAFERRPDKTEGRTFAAEIGPFETGGPNRFQAPTKRSSDTGMGWVLSSLNRLGGKQTIGQTYKGLLHMKPAYDLVLYAALIWELRPKTIIEFGSFHGGSSLWFADQLETMCGHGSVLSFDIAQDLVSPRAKHPRLQFHYADLMNLETLDIELIKRQPHPWVIVDDAHANVLGLFQLLAPLMESGDYFIKEDTQMYDIGQMAQALAVAEEAGMMVDSIYADAFGVNMTCSPNAWFVKP